MYKTGFHSTKKEKQENSPHMLPPCPPVPHAIGPSAASPAPPQYQCHAQEDGMPRPSVLFFSLTVAVPGPSWLPGSEVKRSGKGSQHLNEKSLSPHLVIKGMEGCEGVWGVSVVCKMAWWSQRWTFLLATLSSFLATTKSPFIFKLSNLLSPVSFPSEWRQWFLIERRILYCWQSHPHVPWQPFVNNKLLVLQLNSLKKKKKFGTSPSNSCFYWGPMESFLELGGHPVAKCPKMRFRVYNPIHFCT